MTATFDYEHVVTFDETNVVGNVYFANYLRWQGHCRELFLQEYAPGMVTALAEDLVLVTTRCSCEFFAELYALDRVVVRMSLAQLTQNRVTMRFDYLRGGEIVACGEQQIACLRRSAEGVVSVAVPNELRSALEPYGRPRPVVTT
jgi:enediyne biosynthesis thioesterase